MTRLFVGKRISYPEVLEKVKVEFGYKVISQDRFRRLPGLVRSSVTTVWPLISYRRFSFCNSSVKLAMLQWTATIECRWMSCKVVILYPSTCCTLPWLYTLV